MEDDLVEMLAGQLVACRLWPEQVEGPYFRDLQLVRRNIVEDRVGVPLRIGLRLLEAKTEQPLTGALVEVWQADHEGRYSGFPPFRARAGEVVTSESVSRDVIAPPETFLRGGQRTDHLGMCAFDTIYPGWYPSRTVHIHLTVRLGGWRAVTQLYFPDDLTDRVFTLPPYAACQRRDTVNANDSIFLDGGERTMLTVVGDIADGLTAWICLAIHLPTLPSGLIDEAG